MKEYHQRPEVKMKRKNNYMLEKYMWKQLSDKEQKEILFEHVNQELSKLK
jgi:hypothetical protein